jgi:hypothetical protein
MSQAVTDDIEQKEAEEHLRSVDEEMAYYEAQASQAMLNDTDTDADADADNDPGWEDASAKEVNLPKTLAEMNFKLAHGSVHVRLHEESRDHVFVWVNNRLGKAIHLFRQAMSDLLNDLLPEAYSAFDKFNKETLAEENKIVFSKPLLLTPYVKTVVEVSVFKNKLYVFLKRMSKPEAFLNSPFFKKSGRKAVPYEGPKIDPDKDGFIPSKGCTVQLDPCVDDPEKILTWAKECIATPY